MQRLIYNLAQHTTRVHLNIGIALQLTERASLTPLALALKGLMDRHPALRTRYSARGECDGDGIDIAAVDHLEVPWSETSCDGWSEGQLRTAIDEEVPVLLLPIRQ